MNGRSDRTRRTTRRGASFAAYAFLGAIAATMGGCLDRPLEPVEPRTTKTIVESITQSSVDKIDILLTIDNSRSMADKQKILEAAVPDLVNRLINPLCRNADGVAQAEQPTSPLDDCVSGEREFKPITNIHIGIVTSSLGGHGSDSCPDMTQIPQCDPQPNYTNNDFGRLVWRLDPYNTAYVSTYQDKGFLAWDPEGKLEPPGEVDPAALRDNLGKMVVGAGQIGCGYEAQLESWYRFLVDPEPYATISVINGKATPDGVDQTLLAQRADFLRPDSLVAIIMLTDENDCSIKEYGQSYFAAQISNADGTPVRMPRARTICQSNPNDPCCASCLQSPKDAAGNACPEDPVCATPFLVEEEDQINLRCWDQKRRFGIDFLYPIDRYTNGIVAVDVPNRAGDLVANPLFSDLNTKDDLTGPRDPGLVFFAGIVGVPWQDIARKNVDGVPDLLAGLTTVKDAEGNEIQKPVGGFQNADELATENANGISTWDIILGDPENLVAPLDPLMIESMAQRTGTNPVTGDVLVPGTSETKNPINGNEWTVTRFDDLQYACIFDLLPGTERDCTLPCQACDCGEVVNDNPLCQPDPNDGGTQTYQTKAKAYPGVRELAVLKSVAGQGIVASVCPAQLDPTLISQDDYGYRPAVGAIIDRLKEALRGQCLPFSLKADDEGKVPCVVLEARKDPECVCGAGRQEVAGEHQGAVAAAQALPANPGWDCFCEIVQLTGEQGDQCRNELEPPQGVDGWCYIDATTQPPTGNPAIVADCSATERRLVRPVGEGSPQKGGTLLITCTGDT